MSGAEFKIKTEEINSDIGTSGVGYIAIPDDVDRDLFISDCYRTETVCINGGINAGFFYNISVTKSVIKEIQFPIDSKSFGSPVVWVNIPLFNKPVVVGVLKYEEDFGQNGENEFNISRMIANRSVSLSMRADDATIDINILGDSNNTGALNINIISDNEDSSLDVFVKGKIKLHSTSDIEIISDDKFSFKVVDEDNKELGSIYYKSGVGLFYNDEFSNKIEVKDSELLLDSKKIIHNSGNQAMIRGNDQKGILDEILDAIMSLTVLTPLGPSSVPVNIATFISIKAKLETILSKKSFLE